MRASRRIFRNFVTLFAGNVFGQLLFFLGTLYLARILGPAAFGIWSFAQAWQLYLMRIEDFGLEVTGIREIARHPEATSEWIAKVTIVRLILALGVFAATIVAGVLEFIPLESTKVVVFFSLSVFPIAILTEWVFEAKQNVVITSVARVAKGIMFVTGVLIFVRGSDAIVESTIIYVLSLAIPGIIVFLFTVKRYGFALTSFSISSGVSALRMSSFVGVATVLSHYSLFAGTMMIGYLLTQEDLGLFSAAHRVAVLPWAYVFVSFQRVLLPSLSKWFRERNDQYASFVQRFFRLAVIGSLAVGIAGTFYGPKLMALLYPAAYDASSEIFVILLWALVFAGMRFIFEVALIASDSQGRYLKGMLLLAVVYTLATSVLSLVFGVTGAAWAGVLAECSYLAYLLFTFPYAKVGDLLGHVWKPALGCVTALVLGLLALSIHADVGGPVSLIGFVAFLVLARVVSTDDRQLLRSLVLKETSLQ